MQLCPDGRPKVVDIVDCTGSGDVDTSTVIKGDAVSTVEGVHEIKGLSGRWIYYLFVFCVSFCQLLSASVSIRPPHMFS